MSIKKMGDFTQNPYYEKDDLSLNIHGKSMTQNTFSLQEHLSQIVRERIPERLIYTKGTGAYGTFTVTNDITKFTKAKLFSSIGNTCKVFTRFSASQSEKGSADTNRDTRGFAIKFYTEDGNWDLVGSSSPVFFVKSPAKFSDLIKTQQRSPKTNLKNPTAMWDFYSSNPESLHQLLIQLSGRGTPRGYRHMHGYGSHTYAMINADHERVWVKYHIRTKQGIKNFTPNQASQLKNLNPDFAQEDLINALQTGDFPKWTIYVQVMTEDQAKEFRWNPFDVTKVWFQDEFPLHEIGELELNEIPPDYQSHVEQAAFSPTNIVDGLALSPDPILQTRVFTYPDAQRYRVGRHANLLEVNRCPFSIEKNIKEGESSYFEEKIVSKNPIELEDDYTESAYSENEDDHFTQPGLFYSKALQDYDRVELIRNIIESINEITGSQREEIINRQICHFFRSNIELGMKVAMGLKINIDANMMNHAGS